MLTQDLCPAGAATLLSVPTLPPKAVFRRRAASFDDAQLVAACLKGDSEAWDEVVDRFGRLVYSIPRRYGLSDADADDVFQTAFAILYERLGQLRDPNRLSAWLIRTTHRECYRVGKRSGGYVDLDRVIENVAEPSDDLLETWETRHLVRQALRRLGGRCEGLLTALFLAPGQPRYDTIAEQLGMKIGSIGPTRARCFEKLEKILIDMGLSADPDAESPAGEYQNPL